MLHSSGILEWIKVDTSQVGMVLMHSTLTKKEDFWNGSIPSASYTVIIFDILIFFNSVPFRRTSISVGSRPTLFHSTPRDFGAFESISEVETSIKYPNTHQSA